jgi:hypothetical protein
LQRLSRTSTTTLRPLHQVPGRCSCLFCLATVQGTSHRLVTSCFDFVYYLVYVSIISMSRTHAPVASQGLLYTARARRWSMLPPFGCNHLGMNPYKLGRLLSCGHAAATAKDVLHQPLQEIREPRYAGSLGVPSASISNRGASSITMPAGGCPHACTCSSHTHFIHIQC